MARTGEKQAKAGRGGNVPPRQARWKPGQSGNPAGRPKRTETQQELKALILEYLNETDSKGKSQLRRQIEKLAKLKTDKGARILLEYAFGKVPQPISGDPEKPLEVDVNVKVDDERFDRAISTLADAVRESLPDQGDGEKG